MTSLAEIPRLRQLLLAAAIDRALKAAGSDWHALANGSLTEARQPRAPHWRDSDDTSDAADNWREMQEYCAERTEWLRSREREFIEDLGEWRGAPTERQLAWLCAIYARLRRTT